MNIGNLIIEYFSNLEVHHISVFISAFLGVVSNTLWIIYVAKKIKNKEKNEEIIEVKKKIIFWKILILNIGLFWLNFANLFLFLIPSSKINLNKWIQRVQNKINLLKKK